MADRWERRGRFSAGVIAALVVGVLAVTVSSCDLSPLERDGDAAAHPDGADRQIFWVSCEEVVGLTDAELDEWKSRGVDGFVCALQHLQGLGGEQDFTGDPAADLGGDNYELQRTLRDSKIIERAAARDMKMYLGAYLVNYQNPATPLAEWFDDESWTTLVLPKLTDLAGAAKLLGFAGLAFDTELYPQAAESGATWDWDYPGNVHSEAEVRAQAKLRGEQVMEAILDAFPGVELMAYDVQFPETWHEHVQAEVNDNENAFDDRLDIDFWDGLSSIEGYRALRLIDATFYKTPHLGTWKTALHYHYNRLSAHLSRELSNWDYAASRFFVSPFSWIDEGPCECAYDDPQPPDDVEEQLLAFRTWGMGGEFANYAAQGLSAFDYSPYVSAMQAASDPAEVDGVPPTIEVNPAGVRRVGIEGTAGDNLAVWAVRWSDDRGGSGVATLNWKIESGSDRSGYVGTTRWSIQPEHLTPGASRATVTAEDVKGHTSAPQDIELDQPGR